MDQFVQSFSDLIRDRLTELQLNAFSAENAAGLPPDAIRNVLRSQKQAGPTLAQTKKICDALGLEILIAPKHQLASGVTLGNRGGLDGSAPTGFLTIPWAEMGVGSGSAPVCFSRTWLDAHGLKIDFLKATLPDQIALEGVPEGETLAVIDTRSGLRKGHGIWCYRKAGKVCVARVTHLDLITIIHPADPDHPPEVIEGEVRNGPIFMGKVVWLGQSVPFRGQVA